MKLNRSLIASPARLAWIIATLMVILATLPTATADQPFRLRVLSYNIHHCEGVDRKLDVQRIAEVVRSVQPDIVALQEVDQNVKRSRSVDQPAQLAELTGMRVVFGANIPLQGGQYGNAILSRFPITSYKNHLLPRIDDSEQRGVIEAIIAGPAPLGQLVFLATHLDYRADERERLASAKMINDLVAKRADAAAILAGDMNATPESETMRQLSTVWKITNDDPQFTIPVSEPTKQIDFILSAPPAKWQAIETRVLDEAVASDHRAIFSILQWQASKIDGD
ncbi:MAG TPA: endonuclease [Planctomycetaceae bacterium]|nr:endonuclease [Planctomycetaceae bacterium]